MHLEGRFDVRAGQSEVYDFLTDPSRIGQHIPDVTKVEIQDQDHFTIVAKVGISHIKGTMTIKMAITDRNPPVSTTVVGQGNGLASVVDMVTKFALEAVNGQETIVSWSGEVKVGGKLAAFGSQGLLERIARKNVEQFVEGIKDGIERLSPDGRPVAHAPSDGNP